MTKRIRICTLRKPRADRTRRPPRVSRRHKVIAGLIVAYLALVLLASGYGLHALAFYIATCLAPLACVAMPDYIEPPQPARVDPPESSDAATAG